MIAPYLSSLHERVKPYDIRIGSYPVMTRGVFVSVIGKYRPEGPGKDTECLPETGTTLELIAREVEREIGGSVLDDVEVAKIKASAWQAQYGEVKQK